LKRLQNGLNHAIGIGENVVVPKTHHPPAALFESIRSARIRRIVRMLTAIDFYYQRMFGADEVDDVGPNGVLPAEFVS
jgi:hypothetical protein